MDTYKINKQLVNTDDLFFILSALESLDASFSDKKISFTIDKIKSLISGNQKKEISSLKEKLFLDFSALNVNKSNPKLIEQIDEAITKQRIVEFDYTNQKYIASTRIVEPMTIAFKWYSWYLFGYCRLREDYRLFRLTRINNLKLMDEKFVRREIEFSNYEELGKENYNKSSEQVVLKFPSNMNAFINDYFQWSEIINDEEGNTIVKMKIPIDEWLYSMILSYGENLEVVEPPHIRKEISDRAEKIKSLYQNS